MNRVKQKGVFALFFVAFILLLGTPLKADVGARLYLQGWNPAKPDDIIVTKPYEDAKAVTAVVGLGWTSAVGSICYSIIDTLRAANGGSQGISFKDINCLMARGGDLSLIPLPSYRHENFLLRFVTKDNYLDMHSTTPSLKDGNVEVWAGAGSVLGGQALGLPGLVVTGALSFFEGLFGGHGLGDWADPEFKIYYDLTIDLAVSTSPAFKVTAAKATVSNVRANPANAPGSIIKAATDFAHAVFGTPAFSALVNKGVEAGGNSNCKSDPGTFAICFTDEINKNIKTINDTVMNFVNSNPVSIFGNPVKLVSTAVWGKNSLITFIFAPAAPVPLPLAGAIQGKIRVVKNQWFSTPVCPAAPGLVSDVKVGPRPITEIDPLTYGDAPVRTFLGTIQYIGRPVIQNVTATSFDCPYALTSLPVSVPNYIRYGGDGTGGLPGVTGPSRAASGTGAHMSTVFSIRAVGWDTHVTPNPLLTGKDWEASIGLSLTGSISKVQTQPFIDKGDPYKTKQNAVLQQINPVTTITPAAKSATQKVITPGAAQMLNPQSATPKVQQNIQQR